jgi:hypothetical protein
MKRIILNLAYFIVLTVFPGKAAAQVLYVVNSASRTAGQYNSNTGTPINSSFISGLGNAQDIAISGNNLYVADNIGTDNSGNVGAYNATTGASLFSISIGSEAWLMTQGIAISGNNLFVSANNNTVGLYDATTGALINSNFITSGLSDPRGIVSSGNNLFVCNYSSGTVGQYNATSGASINNNFISGLWDPSDLAIYDNTLFVSVQNNVAAYNITTGSLISSSFVSGNLGYASGLAVSGNSLFVAAQSLNTIGEYDAVSGATVNSSLVTGLSSPTGIAISSVPEPSAVSLLAIGLGGWAIVRRRRL